MKNKYEDLIKQTFEFPQPGFDVIDNELYFNDIPLMDIIRQYGTPLKITYLPRISEQIQRAKIMFNVGMAKADYNGKYYYCYCTKSSQFAFVLQEVLKNDAHIETSSAYDMPIIKDLHAQGLLPKDKYIICNGYKRPMYQEFIVELIEDGFENLVPILDSKREINYYKEHLT
ncbi:MAG: arginine decarboxylase, partial [Bacteroidetes bacterium]|nr:arginine decarboxylase [Bacteroidota bacterium]